MTQFLCHVPKLYTTKSQKAIGNTKLEKRKKNTFFTSLFQHLFLLEDQDA